MQEGFWLVDILEVKVPRCSMFALHVKDCCPSYICPWLCRLTSCMEADWQWIGADALKNLKHSSLLTLAVLQLFSCLVLWVYIKLLLCCSSIAEREVGNFILWSTLPFSPSHVNTSLKSMIKLYLKWFHIIQACDYIPLHVTFHSCSFSYFIIRPSHLAASIGVLRKLFITF